ncbi:hypothetical protein [Altererythrobacter sp. Root672]|uniref:hypothetical protein n=1 Tax=Altererythrobacter sp. Root672 TaxID=1736584 RepID=UPI0006FF201E|nr:hypothetical protein [Altererythrobacter sp. Root672]KRA82878.1 hypothetical protein ASD76_01945 [Altererythrobacter sp. Root672]
MRLRFQIILASCASILLSACGSSGEDTRAESEQDPAITAALNQPISYDPDLSTMNRANSAALLPTQDGSLPIVDRGPDAVEIARAEALRLVGGAGNMRKAPEPQELPEELPVEAALTAGARAAAAPGIDGNCAEQMSYTLQWAAKMPPAFPIYPRGAVQEAAGTDTDGCALRVVNFVTPVPLGEVVDFYFTRARNAGLPAAHGLQNGDNVLAGSKGGRSFVVYARELQSGLVEVDLVTGG